jgi:hypothetical protein
MLESGEVCPRQVLMSTVPAKNITVNAQFFIKSKSNEHFANLEGDLQIEFLKI